MNRTLVFLANGALLVLCCFLAARVIADVAGELLAPAPAQASVLQRGPAVAPQSWEDRQVILTRNLFNASTLAPVPAVAVQDDEEYEKTQLPLRLLGTAASADPSLSWAAVEDLDTRSHLVVRVNDRLKGRADVVRIERKRIVLQNGPRREELGLEEGTGNARPAQKTARRARSPRRGGRSSARTARSARPSPSSDAVRQLGENRFSLDRASVESVAANPASLFSQARFLPKYEDGEMVGLQLNSVKPGSILEQIGIASGDVIKQINGIEVTGEQEGAQVIQELSASTEFNVTVTGADGKSRELQYEVR